ncbi:MAG: type II toxin-antitoxin system RelB family antitoxin [Desulfurivibrionaceae bacterium]
MLTVRLPNDIEDRLNTLSKTTNRPKSFYVREALGRSIEDIEDIYLAEKRLEDIRAGKSKTVPLEEVLKRHGMEG